MASNAGGRIGGARGVLGLINSFAGLSTMAGDATSLIVGGYAVYSHHLRRLLATGWTQEAAEREALRLFEGATERTQQSGHIKDLGAFQRSPVGKLFTMFATSPISYYRYLGASYRNLYYGRGDRGVHLRNIAILQFVLPLLFQWVADGMMSALWGDDEPDEEKMSVIPGVRKSQLRAVVAGPWNGLFIAGGLIDYLIAAGQGEWAMGDFAGRAIPFLTPADDLKRAIVRITSGEDEVTLDDTLKAAEDAVSGASKLVGIPWDPVVRSILGMRDAVAGETEHPVRRALGYSRSALGDPR